MQHGGLVVGLTISAVVGATLLLSLLAGWWGRTQRRWPVAILALGVPVAGLLAYRPLLGKSPTSDLSHDEVQRLWWAVAGMAVVIALLNFGLRRARPTVWRGAIGAAAAVLPAVALVSAFFPFPHPDMSTVQFLMHQLWIPLTTVVAGWLLLEPIAVRSPGSAVPLVMGFLSAGVGALILTSDSTAPGMGVAVVGSTAAGMLGAAWVAHLLGRRLPLTVSASGGLLLIWLTLLAGLMTFCCLDSDTVPTANLLILASVPVLAWLPEIPPVHRWRPWRRELLRALLVAGPVILVGVRAYIAFRRENADIDLSWLPGAAAAV